MKYFEKYFDNLVLVLAVFLGLANFNNAHANTITNLNIGALPTSAVYGNSFTMASSELFYDAYYFSIPDGFANAVTTTVNVGSFLGISGLQARLYSGHSNTIGTVGGSIISPWATMVNPIPGVSVETVVLSPTNPLLAGNYTLQVRGTVTGSGGGSYAGTLNLTPIPEAETYAMLLAGLGLMGVVSRRRKIV
jgi:hypothetical protein